jgi:hypothetical protein
MERWHRERKEDQDQDPGGVHERRERIRLLREAGGLSA